MGKDTARDGNNIAVAMCESYRERKMFTARNVVVAYKGVHACMPFIIGILKTCKKEVLMGATSLSIAERQQFIWKSARCCIEGCSHGLLPEVPYLN